LVNGTVKPDLTTTCEQRPVWVINGQSKSQFYQTPLSNGRFFQVPRVAVVHRFDCISFFGSQSDPISRLIKTTRLLKSTIFLNIKHIYFTFFFFEQIMMNTLNISWETFSNLISYQRLQSGKQHVSLDSTFHKTKLWKTFFSFSFFFNFEPSKII
jgi:hypothetical protein